MPSFRIAVEPHRRIAARFISQVRGKLQKAYAESPNVRQTDIAEKLGIHRSVINRQLRGYQDMTLGRVAEIAWALGRDPEFHLKEHIQAEGSNCDFEKFKIETKSAAGIARTSNLEITI